MQLYKDDLSSFKILLDCANGSNSYIAYQVLTDLKCNITTINRNPNGININQDCGSTHLDMLKTEIKKGNFDFGFAFDGDADRVLFVDSDGETVDGDIIYTVSPGTQTGTRIRLKGKGVPSIRNKDVRGDHYVTLVVQVPDKLTEEQKAILNQYDQVSPVNARATTDSAGGFSFGSHKKRGFRK